MRCVIQRTSGASVKVDGETVGTIERGLVALVCVEDDDTEKDAHYMIDKIANLRIFEDSDDKMNLSVLDVGGSVLVISQFTLSGDVRHGRRPSFIKAARPEQAVPLLDTVMDGLRKAGLTVATGQFQAHMDVSLVNDGPVTILLESKRLF